MSQEIPLSGAEVALRAVRHLLGTSCEENKRLRAELERLRSENELLRFKVHKYHELMPEVSFEWHTLPSSR